MSDGLPVMPVLSTTVGILTDVQEITASIVQFVMYNPGNISDILEDELISFRYLAGKYGYDKNKLCSQLEAGLLSVVKRYFPDLIPIISVTNAPYDGDEAEFRYTITIDITYKDTNDNIIPGINSGTLLVDSENRLTVKYNSSTSIATGESNGTY